ncbi:MAG: 4'-phosphopantetheinyl transferase superfamily protein, partial [Anaerolineae bacterium]|nr:4'-phosphopantetheinyl transferase superfamily protein [Anaerolineae bacterium]
SHSAGRAFCALGEQAMLGADLERIVPRAPGFAADYFTTAERALTAAADAAHRDLMTTAIWCGKEAALKALGLGLTVDTRTVACLGAVPTADAWTRFTIALEESIPIPGSGAAPALLGWWRRLDDFVLTLAADRAVAPT